MKLPNLKALATLFGAMLPLFEQATNACSRVLWKTEQQGVFVGSP